MTRVDPRLSTPHLSTSLNNPAEPTATEAVDTSRRRFLSRCRGDRWRRCACNGSPAVQSGRRRRLAPDPIIEVIEAHKAAHAKVSRGSIAMASSKMSFRRKGVAQATRKSSRLTILDGSKQNGSLAQPGMPRTVPHGRFSKCCPVPERAY
jgi:hypothetical protein